MKVVDVLECVRDELGMSKEDSEISYIDDDRWLCSDGHTFIMGSKKHQNIVFWVEMHKRIIMMIWQLAQKKGDDANTRKNYPGYDLIRRCVQEPRIDIILNTKYGDVAIVAYIDSTFEILLEKTLLSISKK